MSDETSGDSLGTSVRTGGTIGESTNDDCMVRAKNCLKPRDGPKYYKMGSDPRGFCLIFNCYEFPNAPNKRRDGSEREAILLETLFKDLHFDTHVFNNLSAKEIRSTFDEYLHKTEELKKHDAFVLIVLSHGTPLGFYGSDYVEPDPKDKTLIIDNDFVEFDFEIIQKINNKKCPELYDKPKLLFFSCCRGKKEDNGIKRLFSSLSTLSSDTYKEAVSDNDEKYTKVVTKRLIPKVSDIVICYSCLEGYRSWRNIKDGSWLGTALCETLIKLSHEKSLHTILTEVSNIIDSTTAIPIKKDNKKRRLAKQSVEIIYRGFKKKLYFNCGYFGNN